MQTFIKNSVLTRIFLMILSTHCSITGVHAQSAFTIKSDQAKAVYVSSLVSKQNVKSVKSSLKINPKEDLKGKVTNNGKSAVEVVLFSGMEQSKSPAIHARFRLAPGESKELGGFSLEQKNNFAQNLLSQKAVIGMAVAIVGKVKQPILVDVSNLMFSKNMFRVSGKTGAAEFPGEIWFPGDIWFPGEIWFPGDIWFPGEIFFPGETFSP